MSKKWIVNTVLAVVLVALFASAVLPALGHSVAQTHTAGAYSDPIATGNAQQDQYDAIIVQYAQINGLNPFLLKGQIMLESGFNSFAQSNQINAACGWTHDIGLMQINPFCSNIGSSSLFNPSTNVAAGAKIMAQLYHEFSNYDLALQAYNMGSSSVANGQRNWAYSSAVDSYANQFESEHSSIYGSVSFSQQSVPTAQTSTQAASNTGSSSYTVQPGDTLYAIGQRYGISWQSIAQLNGVQGPNYYLYVGQHLSLSSHTSSTGSSDPSYTVHSGDTLYAIGQRYGVSWQSIAQRNGISSPYYIYAGELLNIP